MKKYISLFLIISLLWMPSIYAAAIPSQQGLVTDEAGLLSAQEAAAVARIAAEDSYIFHVLITDSLGGATSADYADEVFTSWGLTAQDILLLISTGNREVEMIFDNQGLQNDLDRWSRSQGGPAGTAAIVNLLDTYFIPSAGEGDFVGGITSLMKELRSIGSPQNSGSGTAAGSVDTGASGDAGGSTSGPAGTSGGQGQGSNTGSPSGQGTGIRADRDGSSLPFPVIAAILIGIAVVVLALFVLFTGLRRRKQLASQQEQLADLLVRANRALESLQPFQGIVQGKTGEMVEGISKRLTSQLVEISALQNSNQTSELPFYRLNALKAAIAQLQQTEASYRSTLEEEEKKIAVISDAERNVKHQITELKKDAPELEEQLQAAVKETGYELHEIAEDLKELAEETAKADQLELFDPIAAQDITEEAQERQESIEQDLRDVDIFDDKINQFPAELAEVRSKIAGLIEQNHLHNMKVKPYDNLEQARIAAESLEAPLRIGDMDEVRKIAATMNALVTEAVAMTERQAMVRQNNLRDLETIRSNWSSLTQRRNGLQSQVAAAKSRFAEHHISSLEEILAESGARLRQGAGEVPQIETWASDARGEYDNARSGLDRLLVLQDETSQQFDGISRNLENLNERLSTVNQLIREGEGRVDQAQLLLRSKGLSSRSRFEPSLLPEYGELEQRLASPPYNLDELESLVQAYVSRITSFVDEVTRLVRQKEAEERAAQLAMMREQQRREQARKRMSSGPPSSGRGGGGRSSGGSSWGGGGRSSGGSSWGGGGKSGGRSSGGSKW